MPVFTAIGGISSMTISIWSVTMDGDAGMIERTPVVFWAVSEVIAVMA